MGAVHRHELLQGLVFCLCHLCLPDRIDHGADMHDHVRTSSRTILRLPVPPPWHRLQLVHQCWSVCSPCSTSTTSAGTHIDGEYGFCPSTCPTDSTASVTTTTTAAPATTTTTTTTTTST